MNASRQTLSLAVAFVAFSLATPAPAASTEKAAEQEVRLVEEMSTVIADNAQDCPKLASALDRFATDRRQALGEMAKRQETLTLEQKKAEQAKFGDRLKKARQLSRPGMVACKDSREVKTAMEKVFTAMGANRPPPAKR